MQIRYETGATNLVVDDDGAVVGVAWKHFTETGAVKAKSVVIAAGGFAMNPDMVAEHTPALGQKRRTKHHGLVAPYILGNPNDDGLGIRMGVSAGGARQEHGPDVHHRGRLPAGDPAHRDHRQQGRASGSSPRTPTIRAPRLSCWSSPTRSAYLIVDEAHMQMPEMPLIKFIDGWETVAEMEAALGIPAGNLAATLDRYNEHAAARRGPRLPQAAGIRCATGQRARGRRSTCRWAGRCTRDSPWAAWRCPSTARCCARTAACVPGLYAAGACASNIAQDGKGYASGTQLGEGSFFGRRAGTHAAGRR